MAANLLRLQCTACRHRSASNKVLGTTYQSCRLQSSDVEPEKKFPSISSEPANLKRGTGGRSSFSGKVATVFGATGFLGRAVINQLGKIGTQVIIPYRGDAHGITKLKLCGDLGQILFQPYNLKDEDSLYKSMKYSNLVINLAGRNFETKNFPFEEVHVKGARNIARIARESGVETLVHVSALNACENPKPIILKKGSGFLKSKWLGEQAVREEFPDAIIFRPSDIYGLNDSFIGYYTSFVRHTGRSLSLWKRGTETIKQPVFQSDVAKGIIRAAFEPYAAGNIFQAVGPNRYELGELMDWFHRVMMQTKERFYYRLDLRYDPTIWIKLLWSEFFFTRWRRLSWERFEREYVTDYVDPELPTLEDLGMELTPLEDRIFFELKLFRAHAYMDPLLTDYIRPVEPCPLAKA